MTTTRRAKPSKDEFDGILAWAVAQAMAKTPEQIEERRQRFTQWERSEPPTTNGDNPHGFLNWDQFWADDTEPPNMLIPGLLPEGAAAALYSEPGIGKSLLLLDLAVRLVTGEPIFGEPTTPRTVIYIDAEQDRALLRERLEDLGCDETTNLTNLHYSLLGDWPALNTDEGGNALVGTVEHFNADLVIIDTISRVIRGEENDNDVWLDLYKHTVRKLKAKHVGFLRLDHAGKDPGKGMRGGSAKAGDVDLIYRLTETSTNDLLLKREKNRLNLEGEPLIGIRRGGTPVRHTLTTADSRREERLHDLITTLDTLGVPPDAGRRIAGRALTNAGYKARALHVHQAQTRRRLTLREPGGPHPRPYGGADIGNHHPGTGGNRLGTGWEPVGNHSGTTPKKVVPDPSGTTSTTYSYTTCTTCNQPLDDVLNTGHHPLCEPPGPPPT